MSKHTLAASIKVGMFAKRDTIDEAFEYVEMMFNTMPDPAHRAAARTALHVMLNTVAGLIEALPDQLPPPPAEIQISVEDNPATGAEVEPVMVSVPREELDRIIDARIVAWINQDLRVELNEWFRDEVDIDEAVQHYMDNSVDFTEIVRDEIRSNITFTVEVD
jgi:hypothetical protein